MTREERLNAYLQDRLDPHERGAFEAEMAAQPALRSEVEALGAAARCLGERAVPEGARAAGWARLSRAIEAERMPRPANDARWDGPLKVAAAAVGAVVLWQLAVVPQLPGSGGFVPAGEESAGAALRVAFAPEAPFAEVTALLQALGAQIIDGPGATGVYTLGFADGPAQDAAEAALQVRPDLVLVVSRP